ncbi:MAG: hypothetical protein QM734_15620 [Cyclobacteriaceae bacterium]
MKNYSAYAQVKDILEKGNYDCLKRNSTFWQQPSDELGYSYKIIETNYHIFMTVETSSGQVLLESTDREHGFVVGAEAIEEKLKGYEKIDALRGEQFYLSSFHLFRQISRSQLPGLLYFNQSVDAFHKKDLIASCSFLQKAWRVYENPRIEEFTPILIRTILLSGLDELEKKQMVSVLREHQRHTFTSTIASKVN